MTISAGVLIEGLYKAVGVAILTSGGLVRGQFERDCVVIERGGTPACGAMTGSALIPK